MPNNSGLELARGKWIAYLGHDDLWMPNHLQQLLNKLEETDAEVAFSLAMAIGAPGCGGRALFGLFENGQYQRGRDVPPSALIHSRALVKTAGNWPDHRTTTGSPQCALLAQFYDHGARFTSLSEVTVFKFPSSWRPMSYIERRSDEQAAVFGRMQNEPDFLQRELTEFAIATQLLRPHTKVVAADPEDQLRPGAVVEGFRRNRGLTSDPPQEGPPRYVRMPALDRLIAQVIHQEIDRRQHGRFAIFEIFYAQRGRYSAEHSKRTLVPIGRWTRVQIPLEHGSDGAPLRVDPCERPAVIELAWVALRSNGQVRWSARGQALDSLTVGGHAFPIKLDRVLTIRSRGDDPMFFLPQRVAVDAPFVFDCWIRVRADIGC